LVQSRFVLHVPQVKLLQTFVVSLQLAAVWQLPTMQALAWQM
jgi:hypothetical protein